MIFNKKQAPKKKKRKTRKKKNHWFLTMLIFSTINLISKLLFIVLRYDKTMIEAYFKSMFEAMANKSAVLSFNPKQLKLKKATTNKGK